MSSFASKFAAGMQIGDSLMNTYSKARQAREISEVMGAKPTELQGYTAQDGEQMQAMAGAINPETGKPYYDVQDNGQGGLQVRSNFAYAGADGAPVAPGAVAGLAPRKVTDFLGQRYEGALDPTKADAMRYSAVANVIGRDDPIRGMQMRRELKRDEREDTKFDQEQEDRTTKLTLEKNRRSYYHGLQEKSPEALAAELGGSFSKDGSGVDAMLTFDPQSNRFMFASNIPGVPSRTLDRSELINYAMGVWEQGNGSFESGMKMQMDTVRALRAQQEASRGDAKILAVANAGAFKDDRKHQVDLGELDVKRGMLGVAQQNANTNENYRRDVVAARGAGGGGKPTLWDQAQQAAAQGNYGGDPERAYAALKRGEDRLNFEANLSKSVQKMVESGMPPDQVQQQLNTYHVVNGVAPPTAVAGLRANVNPETGKPFTPKELQMWDATFPKTPHEDVLGGSLQPTPQQLALIEADAKANGIKAPTYSWTRGSHTVKGNLPGQAPVAGLQTPKGRPAAPAPTSGAETPSQRQQRLLAEWRQAQAAVADAEPSWFQQRTPTSGQQLQMARERALAAEAAYTESLRNR